MLINSCKKERKGNISNTEFENLNNWRVENLNNKSSTFGNLTPNWNSIYTNNLGTQTVYEISLLSSDQTFVTNGFIPKDNSEPYQAKSKIKLILFKDNKTGKITDGCYMATIADEDLHYRQTKSFTGLIYFYAKNGNFTNGWVFENGISTKSISPSTKEEYLKSKNLNFETELGTQNTGKQKLQLAANQFCYTSANPIYGLGCITVGDPPQTVCTPYIKGYYYTSFCLDVNIPTDGGFIPNPSNPTNPGIPPTLPEVPDEPPVDDPCAKKAKILATVANAKVAAQNTEIKNKTPNSNSNEHGAAQNLISPNIASDYKPVTVKEGNNSSIAIDFTWNSSAGYSIGFDHSHPNSTAHSASDVFSLMDNLESPDLVASGDINFYKQNVSITATSPNGTRYVVTVKDWALLKAEYDKYIKNMQTYANELAIISSNYSFNKSLPDWGTAYALLNKLGICINLFKAEPNSNDFKPLQIDSSNNVTTKECP